MEAYSTATSAPCAPGANDNAQLTSRSYNANNQDTGFLYDAAGNVLYDNQNHYLYDAEGRLCAYAFPIAGGGTGYYQFLYDASGTRVAKGSLAWWPSSCQAPTAANGFALYSQFLLDLSGEPVTQLDGSGNPQYSNVFAGGKALATYVFTGAQGLHFNLTDPLGTKRAQVAITSEGAGAPELNCLSLPFGNDIGNTGAADCVQVGNGGSDDNKMHFTGKIRDTNSGLDYFGARYYASSMGRFMSPDWSASEDPVPYADLDNPQTLNLYSYVQNNPLTFHDATGHYHCDPDTATWGPNGVTVTAGACHMDLSDLPMVAMAYGHHFIPKQVWADVDKASNAWKFLNKVTTRALKNPRLSNSFDSLHRGLNKQTEELVRDLEKQLGKSIEDFNKGDFQELSSRLERAGGDFEKFNARMEALEPEARTFGEAVAQALEEVFPAAVEAGAEAAPLAGDAAEGAAAVE